MVTYRQWMTLVSGKRLCLWFVICDKNNALWVWVYYLVTFYNTSKELWQHTNYFTLLGVKVHCAILCLCTHPHVHLDTVHVMYKGTCYLRLYSNASQCNLILYMYCTFNNVLIKWYIIGRWSFRWSFRSRLMYWWQVSYL